MNKELLEAKHKLRLAGYRLIKERNKSWVWDKQDKEWTHHWVYIKFQDYDAMKLMIRNYLGEDWGKSDDDCYVMKSTINVAYKYFDKIKNADPTAKIYDNNLCRGKDITDEVLEEEPEWNDPRDEKYKDQEITEDR